MNMILNPQKLPEGRQYIIVHGTDSFDGILEFCFTCQGTKFLPAQCAQTKITN